MRRKIPLPHPKKLDMFEQGIRKEHVKMDTMISRAGIGV
jgi:hypothetical protein